MKLSFKDISKISLSGFTLVELIVVITIIAILGTVGFVSYSNYLTTARDSNRISQLTKISDALQVYSTTRNLPLPDNGVNITGSGTIVAYQGDLGESVLQTIDYSTSAKDPKDNTPFTYFLSANRLNFQMLAFMEEQKSLQSFVPNVGNDVYAGLYEKRFPKTYGRRLGVLTDTENTPIQSLSIPGDILEITSTALSLKSYLSDGEYVLDNLATLPKLQELVPQQGRFWSVIDNEFVYTGVTRYPNCDSDDIVVGEYRIAACNVGATVAGTGSISYGQYFQWGNNYGSLSDGSTTSTRPNASGYGPGNYYSSNQFITNNVSPYDWSTVRNNNLWGDITDTFEARQGPCAPGYHIPKNMEWYDMVLVGGWGTNGNMMRDALLLPLAGYRVNSTGNFIAGTPNGYYWSSSTTGNFAFRIGFYSSGISTNTGDYRTHGLSVRCFKNIEVEPIPVF